MKTPYLCCLLLFGALLHPYLSSAGSEEDDSLGKYSYPIFAVTDKQQFTGTAFFYRSGDTTYLVSNYHAIKGMSPLKKTITFNSDTLYLKYAAKDSGGARILPIDVSEAAIGETEIFSMVDRIDLLKIPLTLPADADIHFINELIDPAYLNAVPEEVMVFGFPTGPGSIPPFYSQQQRLSGQVNQQGFADYDASLKVNFPGSSDSARAILSGTARYYYFIKPYAAQGYSGAPVFGKFRTQDNKTVYRFTGVVFAGQPMTRQTWAIKGSIALKYLRGEL